MKTTIKILVLCFSLLISFEASATHYFVIDESTGSTDSQKIQNTIDTASVGDTIHFGSSCQCGGSACGFSNSIAPTGCIADGMTLEVADGEIHYKHGITYDGHGSTLLLEGGVDFTQNTGYRMISFRLADYSSTKTVMKDLVLDLNKDYQTGYIEVGNPGYIESKQHTIYVYSTDLGNKEQKQEIDLIDITSQNSFRSTITFYNNVDALCQNCTFKNTHFAVLVTPTSVGHGAFVEIDNMTAHDNVDQSLKIEPPSQPYGPVMVTLKNSGCGLGEDLAEINWTTASATSEGDILELDNICTDRVYANVFRSEIRIIDSSIGDYVNNRTALSFGYVNGMVTVIDTTIFGWAYVGIPQQSEYTSIKFKGVTWNMDKVPTGTSTGAALLTSANFNTDPTRYLILQDCEFENDGTAYNKAVKIDGGYVSIIGTISWTQVGTGSSPNTSKAIRLVTSSTKRSSVLTDGRPSAGDCADHSDGTNCSTSNLWWGW